jgi:hypothetical protein
MPTSKNIFYIKRELRKLGVAVDQNDFNETIFTMLGYTAVGTNVLQASRAWTTVSHPNALPLL